MVEKGGRREGKGEGETTTMQKLEHNRIMTYDRYSNDFRKQEGWPHNEKPT